MGLVSAGYHGTTPSPTMYGVDPSILRRQNENASALLALDPRSQNDRANPVGAQARGGDAGVIDGGVEALLGGHVGGCP